MNPTAQLMNPTPIAVKEYLLNLQEAICKMVETFDQQSSFNRKKIESPTTFAQPRVLADGKHIEKAAVNFTHSKGDAMPSAATVRRPQLSGKSFQAVSLSWIIHPKNPYAPTTHGNLRFFIAGESDPIWWFGGGIDLTPYYGFTEDVIHWHKTAQKACLPFGDAIYPKFKKACDQYFYLPHRKECRGVGGLFFDDWNQNGFNESFGLLQSIGQHFIPAYLPILEKRAKMQYGERQRNHQLYRRGRYVEFNLLYDRGTKYGLQSGRRIESVLASMPPMVSFVYNYSPQVDSPEEQLLTEFLRPRDWI